MKTLLIIFCCVSFHQVCASNDVDRIIFEMTQDVRQVRMYFALQHEKQREALEIFGRNIQNATETNEKVRWLLKRDSVKSVQENLKKLESIDISKIRYLKGLQITRILYDKILALDHHFASSRTFHEINKISNPNHYSEFGKLKELLEKSRKRDNVLQLTGILGTNTISSVVVALGNIINSGLSRKQQQEELENVECIIDFTLRMHADLNTIYFETAFLQKSNEKIRQEVELLFRDYTKPIDYTEPLDKCRTADDWETVKTKTDQYFINMKKADAAKQQRLQVNIDFPVERLLQFITQYNAFIDQGGKFYEKFRIILNSYENERQCQSKIPPEYGKLKSDIDLAIEKFNTAYKPVELNGSKMKEILYGINEFE